MCVQKEVLMLKAMPQKPAVRKSCINLSVGLWQ